MVVGVVVMLVASGVLVAVVVEVVAHVHTYVYTYIHSSTCKHAPVYNPFIHLALTLNLRLSWLGPASEATAAALMSSSSMVCFGVGDY